MSYDPVTEKLLVNMSVPSLATKLKNHIKDEQLDEFLGKWLEQKQTEYPSRKWFGKSQCTSRAWWMT